MVLAFNSHRVWRTVIREVPAAGGGAAPPLAPSHPATRARPLALNRALFDRCSAWCQPRGEARDADAVALALLLCWRAQRSSLMRQLIPADNDTYTHVTVLAVLLLGMGTNIYRSWCVQGLAWAALWDAWAPIEGSGGCACEPQSLCRAQVCARASARAREREQLQRNRKQLLPCLCRGSLMQAEAFVARSHSALFAATALAGWALADTVDFAPKQGQIPVSLLLIACVSRRARCSPTACIHAWARRFLCQDIALHGWQLSAAGLARRAVALALFVFCASSLAMGVMANVTRVSLGMYLAATGLWSLRYSG